MASSEGNILIRSPSIIYLQWYKIENSLNIHFKVKYITSENL